MVAEITLSLVLLTRAGIAVRGLLAMQNQSLGYNPKHALTFLVPLSEGHYTQWANRLALYQNVADKLRRSPQVTVASISATGSPLYGGFQARAILDDQPAAQGARRTYIYGRKRIFCCHRNSCFTRPGFK
jgi:hypothetical protein